MVIVGGDYNEPPAFRRRDTDKKAWILFLVDPGILLGISPQPVSSHRVRPVIVVQHGIEDRLTVGRPGQPAVGPPDHFGQVIAAGSRERNNLTFEREGKKTKGIRRCSRLEIWEKANVEKR